jgi:hypothetical protein
VLPNPATVDVSILVEIYPYVYPLNPSTVDVNVEVMTGIELMYPSEPMPSTVDITLLVFITGIP